MSSVRNLRKALGFRMNISDHAGLFSGCNVSRYFEHDPDNQMLTEPNAVL